MGHWCWMCGRARPNEKFSGKGHGTHLCRDCARKPKAERQAIQDARDIAGFLEQSRISTRNLKRLESLRASEDPNIAEMASVVLEVGRARPGKRKRLKYLARERRDLLDGLRRVGLIAPWHDWTSAEHETFDEWEPVDMDE